MWKRLIVFGILLIPAGLAISKPKSSHVLPAFVETAKVQMSTMTNEVMATGTLTSIPGITIRTEIAGRITKIYFTPGADVTVGTPLIEIYPDVLRGTVAQDHANVELAKLNWERAVRLYRTRTISKSDFDQAQANLDVARGKLEQDTAELKKTTIRAPFSGRLGLNSVNLGDYAKEGQNVVNLQSLDPIYVEFSIPEIYLQNLSLGQTVMLKSNAYPKEEFTGKVCALESLVDVNARSLKMRAEIANHDKKLLPGTFVQVHLVVGDSYQVIKIPQVAVVYETEGNYVYRVIDGKAVRTMAVLGDKDKQDVIVKSGLAVGDVIVVLGQQKVQDGMDVIDKATVPAAAQNAAPSPTKQEKQKPQK